MMTATLDLALDEVEERLGELVHRLLDDRVEEWQHPFRLAQTLQGIAGLQDIYQHDPDGLYDYVASFLRVLREERDSDDEPWADHEVETFLGQVLGVWDRVRVPGGQGALAAAFEEAKAGIELLPPVPRRLGWRFRRLMATAYHLQRYQGDGTIQLPVESLAKLFAAAIAALGDESEVTKPSVSQVAELLKVGRKYGLLIEVDPTYSYRKGRAKEWRFNLQSPCYRIPLRKVK